MYSLHQKLKRLSHCLSNWSRESIGNVFDKVDELENKIADMEAIYEQDGNDTNRIKLHWLYAEKIKWMNMQTSILRQKAKINWEEEGDSNTKYFHSVMRQRRKKAYIHRIKNEEDNWINGNDKTADAAVAYYTSLFFQPHQDYELNFIGN